jgi:GT2 family glycosyltransferase
MTQPLVSIISVNYNGVATTLEMLRSLQRIYCSSIEIIVVDNGSKEDPSPIVQQFPQVKLVRSLENLGFAGGNNLGITAAEGKYLLFLNNDTEVDPDFLGPLVEVIENDPSIGVASPKILFYQSKDQKTIQYAGSTGINPYTIRGAKIGSFEQDQGQYDDLRETALGHGAAMMIPMEVVKKVGLMPDIYFLYYEEHDWFEMIKRAGYKVWYVGASVVYHKESMTVGPNSPLRTYYMTRGRLLFTRRNTRGIQRLSSLLFFVLLALPKNILTLMLKGEFRLLKAFMEGCMWHLRHSDVHQTPQLQLRDGQPPIVTNTSVPDLKYLK